MNSLYILAFMFFMHCIGDYTLQGDFLSAAKRKEFWLNIDSNKKDTFAYLAILSVHAFIWSFCIHIPILSLISKSNNVVISIFINFIIHIFIDDLKANRNKITLCVDQIMHILQILITYILFTL